ncbi:MAG: type I glyceraldehyde-3-phosphate dehydrogenase [Candidatus Acidulodesulfobacterium acidiphilum]|uniref:Glyceraldehyde-3-phosphate dehydrogenase n=1 Tax=Candidatus Acidulodesulfobacterium acidiphilum TaxID=2597224 RepID=A0A520XE42_9DELT|nr:MAG: type I glyceraldehyde-3-phosphate dehydrogenase [Candidatus Acidulodesulfobacterium acidiphilum]
MANLRIAINGFGRIGRNVFRVFQDMIAKGEQIEIVAINDITNPQVLAHLLKYDSVHGKAPFYVGYDVDHIIADDRETLITAIKDPSELLWKHLGVDLVIESTGLFTKRDGAEKHLKAGAKKVLISAPAHDPDATIVLGVNDKNYDKSKHFIVSMASCTTNCLAPVAKVLNENFTIEKGNMTTAHSYTNDQRILDLPHKDLRRARAAAVSIIPTTTGAAKALCEVLPELKDKLDGMSLRVPTPDVSINDLVCKVSKKTTVLEVNSKLEEAADTYLKGILGFSKEPLVSIDYRGDSHSSIVDSLSTKVIGDDLVKVLAWYDNEWGYSTRLAEMAVFMME